MKSRLALFVLLLCVAAESRAQACMFRLVRAESPEDTERARKIFASKDAAHFRADCLALLGPPVLPVDAAHDGESEIATRMLRMLGEAGDVEGMIELLARDRETSIPSMPVLDASKRVMAIALDTNRPVAVRIAAIGASDAAWMKSPPDMEPLVPLLDEPSPDLRIAVIEAVARRARGWSRSRAREILAAHASKETNARARIALAWARERANDPEPAPLHDPIFTVRQDRLRRLAVEYFARVGKDEPSIGFPELHYIAVDDKGMRYEGTPAVYHSSEGASHGDGTFETPLSKGVYELTVTARFTIGKETVERFIGINRFIVDQSFELAPASMTTGRDMRETTQAELTRVGATWVRGAAAPVLLTLIAIWMCVVLRRFASQEPA